MTEGVLSILVIEDDADTRANLCDILKLDDHQVSSAASVTEIMAQRNWPKFDAIVIARKLPEGYAESVLPRLKKRTPQAAIIIVTAYADLDGTIAALRLGASDYILKPINPDALRASIARIAELKRSEQRALQSQRLAAVGQMVTGLAHESRNALQRSQACLELLALEVGDRPEALDLVKRLQRAQDDLHHLYEEVRSYAAPIRLCPERCDLAAIWRDVWDQLEIQRAKREIYFEEHIGRLDLRCDVDPFAIGNVFRNILENAISACPTPGQVQVKCREARISGRPGVRIAVRDNGPGIPSEHRDKIFEPFFTTKIHGTGLGMAIASRIVEAHGGSIAVGARDQGGEILLTLPRGQV